MKDVQKPEQTIKYDLEKVTLIADSMVVSLAGDNLKNEVVEAVIAGNVRHILWQER